MWGEHGHPPAPWGTQPVLTVTAAAGDDGSGQLACMLALCLGHNAELPLHQPLQLMGRQLAQHLRKVGVLPGGTQCHGSALALWALGLPGHMGEQTALPPR